MNLTIKDKITVTFTVDKCTHEQFNGTHTEEFDLSKLTSDDFEQYIAQTLVIKRQAMLRGKTADEKVKIGTWTVPAPGKRISTSPMDKAAELLKKLTPDQIRALLLAQLEDGEN